MDLNNVNLKLTSRKLETTGQTFYCIGILGIICGVVGIGLTIFMGLISLALGGDFLTPMIFDLDSSYAFAYPFVVLAYLALACGIICSPLYFYGMHLFGLGRIAVNTEKEATAVVEDDIPEL